MNPTPRLLVLVVAVVVAMVALGVPPTYADVAAKHRAVEKQTYDVEVRGQVYATQSGGVAYYYCAVGVFAPFDDAEGYEAVRADLVVGGKATRVPIGDPPYDDDATTGGLSFDPYVGQHHVQVGTWIEEAGDATVLARCDQLRNEADAATSDTVTITYEAVGACAKAITKEKKAAKAYKAAKKRVKNATGQALVKAQAALGRAQAKLEKAQNKVIRRCATL